VTTITSSNHSNSNNYQIISTKPIDTKYINQKCALNIYYKVDLSTAIDEHFKKSFNIKNKNKIFQLGKNNKSSSSGKILYILIIISTKFEFPLFIESQSSKNFKHQTNSYWNESLKSNVSPIQASASSYDMYSWPYYSYNTPTTTPTSSNSHNNHTATNSTNTNHVHESWNRAAVDMAASLYSNSHYASSLTNIHHHHHHQYNSLLTNNIFNDSTTNQNNTGSHHHLYNQPTTADLLSTLTNTNIRNNDLLTQKYSKNSQESSHTPTTQTPSTNSFLVPTNAYTFSSSLNNSNQQQHQTQQIQSSETSSQQTLESYNHLTDIASNTSYPITYNTCNNDANFIEYSASASSSNSNSNSASTVAKVAAAAAAVAANQYLNASLNAATNSAQNNSSYQRYHHPQYLNHHLELSKSSIQDCRRANNHYAHLSTHLPYPGNKS
jgi:hypothetical protein